MRWRLYRRWGLGAADAAAVAGFAALSFFLGMAAIGLGALLLAPDALGPAAPWPPETVRAGAAAAALTAAAALLLTARRRAPLRLGKLRPPAPGPRMIAGQLAVTLADLAFAALALHALLPPEAAPGFGRFLAVFCVATMAGVISNVPGGLGVFEAVIAASLAADAPIEALAAALALHRLIYFLIPFSLSAAGLGALGLDAHRRIPALIASARAAAMPAAGPLSAGAALICGAALALLPWADEPKATAARISAVCGAALLMLIGGLSRRVAGAPPLAAGAAICGAAAAAAAGDGVTAAVVASAAAILAPLRPAFDRPARLAAAAASPRRIARLAATAGAAALFAALAARSGSADAPPGLALAASAALALAAVWRALGPAPAAMRAPDADAPAAAAAIIDRHGPPEAEMAMSADKALFFSPDEDAFIMFAPQGRSWIAYADPVGPETSLPALIDAFCDAARAAGARPVFYETSDRLLAHWIDRGMRVRKIGEEALVSLPDWSLSGRRHRTLRNACSKLRREGLAAELHLPPHAPALLDALEDVSREWLASKGGREKRFSVGAFDRRRLSRQPVLTLSENGRLVAFASLLAPAGGARAAIDLMRHRACGRRVMDLLFVELIEACKARGMRELSLGMAPLAGLDGRRGGHLWNRLGAIIYRHGGAFYNFAGLRNFKAKFATDWRPRYLATPARSSTLGALKDAAMLIADGPLGLAPPRAARALRRATRPLRPRAEAGRASRSRPSCAAQEALLGSASAASCGQAS
ncbi:phosphatidylglycerol lysyltransferase [Oceanicella actignis]|uniref:Phosphatidylglycerol lysyltransferase n=3 Tax=Oceanicella actignis TaxID=1189325 RepID=A0A1M7S8G7_9RHOB|nr:phosphatidylglycerol lysyltransferase [Oceanicella actignis]SHN54730.1 phosphatidylglycerol lysyltransferase [Oceanicella actignis]